MHCHFDVSGQRNIQIALLKEITKLLGQNIAVECSFHNDRGIGVSYCHRAMTLPCGYVAAFRLDHWI